MNVPSFHLEQLRDKFVQLRSQAQNLRLDEGKKVSADSVTVFEGLLTCGISALYNEVERLKRDEIGMEDVESGFSLSFSPRGIGCDSCPGCFVCGGDTKLYSNIAAFVKSKEDGLQIVTWFERGARLDWRDSEPNWIQVKIGACDKHMPNLYRLMEDTAWYCRIRKSTIEAVRNLSP
jgi:hypothetical protein